jgi:hypothetical protein
MCTGCDVHGVAETAPTKCSFPFRRNTSISPTMLSCFSCCKVQVHYCRGHVHSTRKATPTPDTGHQLRNNNNYSCYNHTLLVREYHLRLFNFSSFMAYDTLSFVE